MHIFIAIFLLAIGLTIAIMSTIDKVEPEVKVKLSVHAQSWGESRRLLAQAIGEARRHNQEINNKRTPHPSLKTKAMPISDSDKELLAKYLPQYYQWRDHQIFAGFGHEGTQAVYRAHYSLFNHYPSLSCSACVMKAVDMVYAEYLKTGL